MNKLKQILILLAALAGAGAHAATTSCGTPYGELDAVSTSFDLLATTSAISSVKGTMVGALADLSAPVLRIRYNFEVSPTSVTSYAGTNKTFVLYKAGPTPVEVPGVATVTDVNGNAAFATDGTRKVPLVDAHYISFRPTAPLQPNTQYFFRTKGVDLDVDVTPAVIIGGTTSNQLGTVGIEGISKACIVWPVQPVKIIDIQFKTAKCEKLDFSKAPVKPVVGCVYDMEWSNYGMHTGLDWPDPHTFKLNIGRFEYSRTGTMDFGMRVTMSNVRFDVASQLWLAETTNVYKLAEQGQGPLPFEPPKSSDLLASFRNLTVLAKSDPSFGYTERTTNDRYGTPVVIYTGTPPYNPYRTEIYQAVLIPRN